MKSFMNGSSGSDAGKTVGPLIDQLTKKTAQLEGTIQTQNGTITAMQTAIS